MSDYGAFLKAKVRLDHGCGFEVDGDEVHPLLKPHQRDCVVWAVRGGKRALFESFGLGKSVQQLEIIRLILKKLGGGRGLIVAPLGVRQEFMRDAAMLGLTLRFVRWSAELAQQELIEAGSGIWITNYESVRDGRLDPNLFDVVSLDEASCLRGFGGTKTFREFMALFAGDRKTMAGHELGRGVQYRFVATATPSPNEFIELLAYSAFLGIMDVSQAKTRFFKRDSTQADVLTLHGHKEREFWLWIASWAIFLQKPSDLGYSDDGYEMPELDVRWHEVSSDFSDVATEKDGQGRFFRSVAIGVTDAAREKRESLPGRIAKMMELRAEDPGAHRLIWHDLEAEREAIEQAIPSAVSVFGNQELEARERSIIEFSDGKIQELAAKPVLAGSGCNFQYHCHWAIFIGIGFKFNDFIQAVHRIQRFLQQHRVRIDLIYTEAEREIRKQLERKWAQHNELVAQMTAVIREFGLSGKEILPVTFMLLQPQSWHEDVWTDVTRMRTLNAEQWSKGKEMHLCPMQFDIADRVIAQMSMPGETVFDPFAGLGTVPMRAVKLGRRGVGCELNRAYWLDAIWYCKAAEREAATPTLFGLEEAERLTEDEAA